MTYIENPIITKAPNLVKIADTMYRFDQGPSGLAPYGWTYAIYYDTVNKYYVVPGFGPSKDHTLYFDALPEYGENYTIDSFKLQHHVTDMVSNTPVMYHPVIRIDQH